MSDAEFCRRIEKAGVYSSSRIATAGILKCELLVSVQMSKKDG